MKKKAKNYKKRCIAFTALLAIMVLAAVSVSAGTVSSAAPTKPAKVKNLKRVKVTKNSVKVKYKKAKGAAGYQILIYERVQKIDHPTQTPLVYAFDTKKTTYTIKHLVPGHKYTVKVRAYNKEGVYGKMASVKANTTGKRELTYACNSCRVFVPYNGSGYGYDLYMAEHSKAVRDVLGERHCGETLW